MQLPTVCLISTQWQHIHSLDPFNQLFCMGKPRRQVELDQNVYRVVWETCDIDSQQHALHYCKYKGFLTPMVTSPVR